MRFKAVFLLCCLLPAAPAFSQDGQITIDAAAPGHPIPPSFFGLMTEEINHSYDGGLYGELIQNRSLKDDPKDAVHWSIVEDGGTGAVALEKTEPIPNTLLDSFLKLDVTACGKGQKVGVANDGYWGIPVAPNTRYHVSFYAKASQPLHAPLLLSIESADGSKVWAKATVQGVATSWRKYEVDLRTGPVAASTANRFAIYASEPATLEFTQVSLFPPTFRGTKNGNRIDLMKLLGNMKPSFLRLPGGNYLEGDTIEERFDWKKTIGDISTRPGHRSPWGYRSSDGLGLLEYLEWCEDLDMQPLLAVYAGYSLRQQHIDPGPALQPYVQDALDEIEYVTGDASTKWGAERAKDGHPKPFKLTYVEIGNEDWFDRSQTYGGRFAQFFDAIKKAYSALKVIATMPVQSRTPDVVDDHYYRSAAAMALDAGHYDNSDRNGPKIFVGEWASTQGSPTPTFGAALGDAAWLTGLERNSDLVLMEAYAPLLVNVNKGGAQWPTNLIGYDAEKSFGSPSYWVQSLFAKNTGDRTVPSKIELNLAPEPKPVFHGAIGLGTYETQAEFKDVSVTQGGRMLFQDSFDTDSGAWSKKKGIWSVSGGTFKQVGNDQGAIAIAGDDTWTDFTLDVKARKISGNEGFLIIFHRTSDDSYWQWNVGGWGNSRSALQHFTQYGPESGGQPARTSIAKDRWYDLKVELKGGTIKCYIDDKLVNQGTETNPPVPPLYVAASREGANGQVIVKVVNFYAKDLNLAVTLDGIEDPNSTARGWIMQGDPAATNSLEEPEKVSPHAITIQGVAQKFTHEFPAFSITVFRISEGGS